MSSDSFAIDAQGLAKAYPLFDSKMDRLRYAFNFGRERVRLFWALRGFDFSVRRGETVGLVGRNGSGKTTAIRLLAGTLQPTTGALRVEGKIAPILGLGVGFNPDFGGRENAVINASVLGFSEDEIRETLPRIEEFANIGSFFERPVRTYSNGMRARLAFAVAVNTNPDILLIDEVLAVGDEGFKRRCFARIEELKSNGVTTVFVSHSSNLVTELCDRAVLLEGGRTLLEGDPKEVVARYHQLVYASPKRLQKVIEEIEGVNQRSGTRDNGSADPVPVASQPMARFDPGLCPESTLMYESHGAMIGNPVLRNGDGNRVNIIDQSVACEYSYEVRFRAAAHRVRFGMMIKLATGVEIGGQVTHPAGSGIERIEAGTQVTVHFSLRPALAPGTYFLNAGVRGELDGAETYLHRIIDAAILRVDASGPTCVTGFADLSGDPPRFEIQRECVTESTVNSAAEGV